MIHDGAKSDYRFLLNFTGAKFFMNDSKNLILQLYYLTP
jgi:hypothetical protein